MKRVIIICEGETEQAFCKTNLQQYFELKGIYIYCPLIKRSKGGIVRWPLLKKEIETYLKTDKSAFVTTFIDYYGLYSKHEFPCWDEAENFSDCNKRIDFLEEEMFKDVEESLRYRFIPYLQLHEFEGLLFNNIDVFYNLFPLNDIVGKTELEDIFRCYDNPEMINNSRETSPSHRLERIIRGYNKIVYGDILAEAIGLHNMRNKSPRFNQWITRLEQL